MNLINKVKNHQTLELLEEANKITLAVHGNIITLERAIFLSWWCDKGDCAFCYMSAQKPRIKEPGRLEGKLNPYLPRLNLQGVWDGI